ncbi:MAG TPA: ribosomal L7Ae/L30e/S12e/Gadd45 family protein [Candidatus Cloacimonadota bacterium]|nr:ribosomal L7Ae/L30e/S12e/Gadd45 family protein [Candidatus Cloacimonadota bacterium]
MTATPKKHPRPARNSSAPRGAGSQPGAKKLPAPRPRVTPAQASDSLPVKARARQTIAVTAPQLKKMTTLMQFARRAGKLISGYDACLRAMHQHKLYLVLLAEDTAPRTCRGIDHALNENQIAIPLMRAGNQTDLSQALGLPKSGVFGIGDKQFAKAIQACAGMEPRREEPCK